jgi:DNA-binding NtrC family response regulator
MPARVVMVHDETEFAAGVAAALRLTGNDVAVFADPMRALDALDAAQRIEVLITQIKFAPGKPNGVALARMAQTKRPGTRRPWTRRPWIKVLFTALPEFAEHAAGLGEFVAMPACVTDVAAAVDGLLLAAEQEAQAATLKQPAGKPVTPPLDLRATPYPVRLIGWAADPPADACRPPANPGTFRRRSQPSRRDDAGSRARFLIGLEAS